MMEKKEAQEKEKTKTKKSKTSVFIEQFELEDQSFLENDFNVSTKNTPKKKNRNSTPKANLAENQSEVELTKSKPKSNNTLSKKVSENKKEETEQISINEEKPASKSRGRRTGQKQSTTQENKVEEVAKKDLLPKRKPGRPTKKHNTHPILELESSKRLALEEREKIAISSNQRLALENHEKIALENKKKLAIKSQVKKAILDDDKLAIEYQNKKAIDQNKIEPKNLPKPIIAENLKIDAEQVANFAVNESSTPLKPRGRRGSRATTNANKSSERTSIKPKNLAEKNQENTELLEKRQENIELGETKNINKTAKPKKINNQTQNEPIANNQEVNSQNQTYGFGEYSEQAALGVLGIIDEAPSVDALLPLMPVITEENTLESNLQHDKIVEKKEEKSKKNARYTTKNKEKKPENVTRDLDAPIAEGGELAILEAEQSVKKQNVKPKKEKNEQVHRVLYVSAIPDEQVEVVITENGVVSEYFVEMAHQAKIRGNIYKGVINNVDNNLQAAFVNFGSGKNGFLQIDEVHPEYWLTHHTEGGRFPPIQKVLKIGQEVLVQVVKEPSGSKGAFLTTWLSLAGRFIVLTPGQEQIGVSRKVEDGSERTRLRALLTNIKPGDNMGVIIRTASEGASKSNIQSDLKFLKRAWKEIQKKVVAQSAPSLIYQEADLSSRAVRDYLTEDIDEIWVDSEELRNSLHDLVKMVFPKRKNMLNLHKDSRHSLWERFNILHQLEEVTKREVILPSGGRLVFDQTEALMAIDINSGKTHSKSNFESMVFRTNMEAAEAIARHLRLRDIGGQVVIDFIEMRDKNHCREVEKCITNAMKRDKARHDIGKISSFGLLELVRQRTGTSAISMSSEPCPHCRGVGFRRNLEWQAQGVLRDIKSKLAGKTISHSFVHYVEQDIAFYILNKKRDRLQDLENLYNLKIEILSK